jgi:2-keto-4-pentenoate hydratase/2-oxohepta-3-ene-1,7-dioic acid hydratase in catechol pathway
MKIARVIDAGGTERLVRLEPDGGCTGLRGDPLGECEPTGEAVEAARWLPPVRPAALLCIGLNYRAHAAEGGKAVPRHPVLFLKNPSAALGHGEPIRIPKVCADEVDFEAELAVVLGKRCRDVPREDALNCVAGYTAANDVSARVWQLLKSGSQWCRAKGFDTFAPLGPAMVTPDDVPDPNALAIRSILNGEVMQESSTADMIFDVPSLIAFLSQDTTLLPGTVILTGTPAGIGWAREPKVLLHPGDTIEIDIEGIGRLRNPVRAAQA